MSGMEGHNDHIAPRALSAPIPGAPHYPIHPSTIHNYGSRGETVTTLTATLDPSLHTVPGGAHFESEQFQRQFGPTQQYTVIDPNLKGTLQEKILFLKKEGKQESSSTPIGHPSDNEVVYISSDYGKGAGP